MLRANSFKNSVVDATQRDVVKNDPSSSPTVGGGTKRQLVDGERASDSARTHCEKWISDSGISSADSDHFHPSMDNPSKHGVAGRKPSLLVEGNDSVVGDSVLDNVLGSGVMLDEVASGGSTVTINNQDGGVAAKDQTEANAASLDLENVVGLAEETYHDMLHRNVRRMSSTLAELHVYLIPRTSWEESRNLADKSVMDNSISVGFVRVLPDLNIVHLRDEINVQLEADKIPETYAFVRGVGRHLAEIRSKQEQLLKVRNFLPPQAAEPEIFLLENLLQDQLSNEQASELSSAVNPKDAEKVRLQETLHRMRTVRNEGRLRREQLLNRAKQFQARANRYKEKLAIVWEERLKEEQEKTAPLEEVCAALREDLDGQHKKRMEAFETKMKPIVVTDAPSRKANYKITAARLHYDIYALTQRLRLTTIRVEYEETKRERRERQVRKLRDEISEKKTMITTVTKGIPFTKIEVRPQDQLPKHSGPMIGENPLLTSTATAAMLAAGWGTPSSLTGSFNLLGTTPSPAPTASGRTSTLPALGNSRLTGFNSSNFSSQRAPAFANVPLGIPDTAAAAAAARLVNEDSNDDEELGDQS